LRYRAELRVVVDRGQPRGGGADQGVQAEVSGGRHVTTTGTTSITSISATSTATTRGLECCYEGSANTGFIDHLRDTSVGFVAHSLTVMMISSAFVHRSIVIFGVWLRVLIRNAFEVDNRF
jgi:hypothetical protein